jgi:hypothetical protein
MNRGIFAGAMVLAGLLGSREAAAYRPTACPSASYVLHSPLGAGPVEGTDVLTVDAAGISLGDVCAEADRAIVRGIRRKGTRVIGRWESCAGLGDQVRIRGTIDPSCGTFTGVVKVGNPPFKIPVVATQSNGESLRIVTYNIQQLPSFFNAGTSNDRTHRIAERIVAGGYDFVAFNEVQDEESRVTLVKDLKGTFPYYISKLDTGPAEEDSALAFFSRFPLEDPIMSLWEPESDDCEGDCSNVRFIDFFSCTTDDCHANKGVGYVRVKNPETGTPYNVLFSHTQASYPGADSHEEADKHVLVRSYQYADIKRIVDDLEAHAFPNIYDEAILIMGDLNIDGDLESPYVWDVNWGIHHEVKNIAEWQQVFGTPGSDFHDTFIDGWAFDNAPKDPSGNYDRGITNRGHYGPGAEGARLDYIVHNDMRLCVQHMTIAHNLRWSGVGGPWTETGMGPIGIGSGGSQQLSDHRGVNADVNLWAPHCRPVDANLVDPYPGAVETIQGEIRYPGSIQWHRFDEPGTYSFAVLSDNGADFRVYQADDLSTPAGQYKNMTTTVVVPGAAHAEVTAKVFHMAEAPFYVRVWNPTRTRTGIYRLIAVEHNCATKEFFCALGPGEERSYHQLPDPPLNGEDEAWFLAVPEALPAGMAAQSLTFVARGIGIPEVYTLTLEDTAGSVLAQAGAPEPDPQDATRQRYRIPTTDANGSHIYMRVRRQPAGGYGPPGQYPSGASNFWVWWQTNLTILYGAAHDGEPFEVWCHEENDNTPDDGDDEVYLDYVRVDGTEIAGYQFIADFDAPNNRPLEHIVPTPIYFFSGVEIKFMEDDSAFNGENDYMYGVIAPMPPEQTGHVKGAELTLHDQEGAGTYTVYYNLTHGFDD